ncbi:MAG: endonuclease III [Nanoarchaeota archaeon]
MNKQQRALKILKILKNEYHKYQTPVSTYFQEKTNNTFKVLIATILSPRAKDTQTEKVANSLFKIADTPEKIIKLDTKKLQEIIYSIGFYKTKAKRVKQASQFLLDNHNGKIPQTLEELIKIPGVGRKVANIILSECFNQDVIPIDTHMHKIPNRMGLIKTKKPLETEQALMKIYPRQEWKTLNKYFVVHGQNTCLPVSPKCSICPVNKYCEKLGIKHSR